VKLEPDEKKKKKVLSTTEPQPEVHRRLHRSHFRWLGRRGVTVGYLIAQHFTPS